MTKEETLISISSLLTQVEALNPQTLGLDARCISDMIDDINYQLNSDSMDT